MKKKFLLALAAALVAGATPALAHPGHGEAVGLIHGFVHPMSGIDHILAMVAVGLFAAQLGGRALWLVPTSFVTMMGVGGMLGISGVDVPFVEVGIAMSVVVLGLCDCLCGSSAGGTSHGPCRCLCHFPWPCPWRGNAG